MLRFFTISLVSLIVSQAALAQNVYPGPALNRSGYGGYATSPVVYPDRTGLGGYGTPTGPGGLYSLGVARNGFGGLASSAGPSTPTFTYLPGGLTGNSAPQGGLFNYPVIGSGTQAPRPVTYFSFTNPIAPALNVSVPMTIFSNPTPSATTGGGYYVLPRR